MGCWIIRIRCVDAILVRVGAGDCMARGLFFLSLFLLIWAIDSSLMNKTNKQKKGDMNEEKILVAFCGNKNKFVTSDLYTKKRINWLITYEINDRSFYIYVWDAWSFCNFKSGYFLTKETNQDESLISNHKSFKKLFCWFKESKKWIFFLFLFF